MKTFILNFGHTLRADVPERLDAEEVRVPFALDLAAPTAPQVAEMVNGAEAALLRQGGRLDGTCPLFVVLPGMTEGAALVLAELHGRMGLFPRVVVLRREEDGTFGLVPPLSAERLAEVESRLATLEKVLKPVRGQRREKAELTVQLRWATGVLDLEQVRQAARGRRWYSAAVNADGTTGSESSGLPGV